MFVIRKKLSASEGAPPGTRVNPETGEVETTPDGGTTWNDDPANDPRKNPAYQLPASGDGDCAAAGGMVIAMKEFVQKVFLGTTLIGSANSALLLIVAMLPGAGWLFTVALAIASAVIAGGTGVIAASFTTLVWDQILCALVDNINSDGTMTIDQLESIQARILDECGSTVALGVSLMAQAWGAVGFSNAGALNADPATDCDICAPQWCYQWTDITGYSDWTQYPGQPGTLTAAGWDTGLVFVGGDPARGRTQNIIQVTGLTPGTIYTHMRFDLQLTQGIVADSTGISIWINDFAELLTTPTNGADGLHPYEWDGERDDISSIQFVFSAGGCDTCGDPGGTANNPFIALYGEDAPPTEYSGGEVC